MGGTPSEFDLIARIRARAGSRADVLLGIGDDAAILRVPAGHDLVVSTDTLNIGVHFPPDTAPADIGWKSLAVNLSDLASMGAEPAWCTLNLALPNADSDWLDAFLDGFLELATRHDVALVGGDTTRGPLSITVTVHGFVPHGTALRRGGAQAGDDVWISGTAGDAAAGLALLSPSTFGRGVAVRGAAVRDLASFAPHPPLAQLEPTSSRLSPWPTALPEGEGAGQLRARLNRPTPRVALGLALHGIASACIDVSDGLLADLGHVALASNAGAEIDVTLLPTSTALLSAVDPTSRIAMQLGGGDDYELCFTASPAHAADVTVAAKRAGVAVTRIGRIEAQTGLRVRGADGVVREAQANGYRHFDMTRDEAGQP